MKEVTLSIEDKNFEAFINFVKTLDYVKVTEDTPPPVSTEGKPKEQDKPKSSVNKFLNKL